MPGLPTCTGVQDGAQQMRGAVQRGDRTTRTRGAISRRLRPEPMNPSRVMRSCLDSFGGFQLYTDWASATVSSRDSNPSAMPARSASARGPPARARCRAHEDPDLPRLEWGDSADRGCHRAGLRTRGIAFSARLARRRDGLEGALGNTCGERFNAPLHENTRGIHASGLQSSRPAC